MTTALIKNNCPDKSIAGRLCTVTPEPNFEGQVYRVQLQGHFARVNKMFVDFEKKNYHGPVDKRVH